MEFRHIVEQGKLKLSDFVTNRVLLTQMTHEELHVSDYDDQESLRGKGVANSFYKRLRELAQHMGFRFLTGLNTPRNVGYFVEKLGRVRLRDVKPDLRASLKSNYSTNDLDFFTVDFLNPHDKEQFLSQ